MTDISVRFDERAERDAEAAVEWYTEQRAGLGAEFLAALDQTIDNIARHPDMYPRVISDVRRALTPKFPYSVYYERCREVVTVVAVLHTRRARQTVTERTTGDNQDA